jgi:poly(3-hydroxybutyrate) depolymerase
MQKVRGMPTHPKLRHTETEATLEHSVPGFWPFMALAELGEVGMHVFRHNLGFAEEALKIDHGLHPKWVTKHQVMYALDTLTLRNFSPEAPADAVPTLIDPPYAGHPSTIADFATGQSLVQVLLDAGLRRVALMDWHSATPEMKDYDIDTYLAEINVVVDDLGGRVNLVGLCQGGWMAAMYAARFPQKVASFVVAGTPLDCDAGNGFVKRTAKSLPLSFYEELVTMGDGRMLGKFMLTGWKSMHPERNYFEKYTELYEHLDDPGFKAREEAFYRWYENPVDLPGRWYLQAISHLFQHNDFWHGRFVGLGRRLRLGDIPCPAYLLAGEKDDITPAPQVFAAERVLGGPKHRLVKQLVPGGHIGLFMGHETLRTAWPKIGAWIVGASPGS